MPNDLNIAHIIYTGVLGFWYDHDKHVIHVLAPNGIKHQPTHFVWLRCHTDQYDTHSGLTPIHVGSNSKFFYVGGTMALEGVDTSERLKPFEDGKSEIEPSEIYTQDNLVPLKRSGRDPRVPLSLNSDLIGLNGGLMTESSQLISFQADISHGRLDVCYVNRAEKWRFKFPWRFSTLNEIWQARNWQRRLLAEQVCHRVKLNTPTPSKNSEPRLRVNFTLHDGSKGHVALKVGKVKVPILIMIGNTSSDGLATSGTPGTERDHHVKLLHELSSQAKDGSNSPLPHLDPKEVEGRVDRVNHPHRWPRGEPVAAHGANCPPGWWDSAE